MSSDRSDVIDKTPNGSAPVRLATLKGLVDASLLKADDMKALEKLARQYDIGLTDHIVSLLKARGDLKNDPIALQYVPNIKELNIRADEENDPIGDNVYSPVRGIVHRYPDRVLFKVSSVCAVYCRYCFRKEMIGAGAEHLNDDDFERAIEYIKAHKEIWEVILTGGDPLTLSPRRLQKIIDALRDVEHVQVIRIHSRIPVANPSRINDTLLCVLENSAQSMQMVIHVNHRDELTSDVEGKIHALRMAGCSVFSQSVLLKGVNDKVETLGGLFKALIKMHVKPYYLHHLDRAKGTSHFRVSLARGQEIMKELQGCISGICLPTYMLDIPGGHGKVPVNETYVRHQDHDVYRVTDYQGCTHLYFDTMPEDISEEAGAQ